MNHTAISATPLQKLTNHPNCDACGAALPGLTRALERVCRYCGASYLTARGRRAVAAARTRGTLLMVFLVMKVAALLGALVSALGAVASYVVAGAVTVVLLVGYALVFVLVQFVLPMVQ